MFDTTDSIFRHMFRTAIQVTPKAISWSKAQAFAIAQAPFKVIISDWKNIYYVFGKFNFYISFSRLNAIVSERQTESVIEIDVIGEAGELRMCFS